MLKDYKHRCVFDAAEPKSIAELRKSGLDIHPSQKGPDSINNGINLVKQFKLNVHVDSINAISELRRYTWAENKQGERLTKPIDLHNHICDSLRYGAFDLFNKKSIFFI